MADSVFMPINGRREEDGAQANKTTRSLWPWSQRKIVIGFYSWGEMALRGRCKLLCDLSGRERKREEEQKTSFLKKET